MRVFLATVSLLLFACGDDVVELGETPMPTTAMPPLSATPTIVPSVTPTPEPVASPTTEPYATPTPEFEGGGRCAFGEAHLSLSNSPTVEERFAASERSARVRLRDIRVVPADVANWGYTGTIEFDLEVLEWLSGDGPSEFTAKSGSRHDVRVFTSQRQRGGTYGSQHRAEKTLGTGRRGDPLSWRIGDGSLTHLDILAKSTTFRKMGVKSRSQYSFGNLTWLPKIPNEDKYVFIPTLRGQKASITQ